MAKNIWISIPLEDFFHVSFDLMKKYNVTIYIEKLDKKQSKRGKRNFIPYNEGDGLNFVKHFYDIDYLRFYFSCYPFEQIENITDYAAFYKDEDICSNSIEGSGGYETGRSRELFYLRFISLQPSKNIDKFFSALQRRLKSIPGLQNNLVMGKHIYKNHYFLPTSKEIIPPNLRNRDIEGTWEDFCLARDGVRT